MSTTVALEALQFSDLVEELLVHIFRFLSYDALYELAFVSRSLRRIATDRILRLVRMLTPKFRFPHLPRPSLARVRLHSRHCLPFKPALVSETRVGWLGYSRNFSSRNSLVPSLACRLLGIHLFHFSFIQ